MNKRGMIAQLIGAFVVILIGVSLIPLVAEQVNLMASASYNDSNSFLGSNPEIGKNLPGVLTGLFALAVLLTAIMAVYSALKGTGLIGGTHKIKSGRIEDKSDETSEKLSCKIKTYKSGEFKKEPKKDEEISTKIVTTTKEGIKISKLGKGYHVDQYALEPPLEDSSLTITEDNFKKTKYD